MDCSPEHVQKTFRTIRDSLTIAPDASDWKHQVLQQDTLNEGAALFLCLCSVNPENASFVKYDVFKSEMFCDLACSILAEETAFSTETYTYLFASCAECEDFCNCSLSYAFKCVLEHRAHKTEQELLTSTPCRALSTCMLVKEAREKDILTECEASSLEQCFLDKGLRQAFLDKYLCIEFLDAEEKHAHLCTKLQVGI